MECCSDVVPFMAMECLRVTSKALFKAATIKGTSYQVFMVYSYAIAFIIHLFSQFFSTRYAGLPPPSLSVLSKIALVVLSGPDTDIFRDCVKLSSSCFSHEQPHPSFTIIFRCTCALVVSLYQGLPIKLLGISESSWVVGSLLLSTAYILVVVRFVVLTMKEYPSELTVMFVCNTCMCILCLVVGLVAEPNWDSWRIGLDIKLASVLCSGVFVSFLSNIGHAWVLHLKRPVYVAMFKPLSIAVAVAMGVMFLGDILYLGSVIGAVINVLDFIR